MYLVAYSNEFDLFFQLHSVALDYYNCHGMTENLFQKFLFWAVRKGNNIILFHLI